MDGYRVTITHTLLLPPPPFLSGLGVKDIPVRGTPHWAGLCKLLPAYSVAHTVRPLAVLWLRLRGGVVVMPTEMFVTVCCPGSVHTES